MIHVNIEASNHDDLRAQLQGLLSNMQGAASGCAVADATPTTFTYGVNVYRSTQQPFCLGHKLYRDATEANRNSTGNGNHVRAFNLTLDASGRAEQFGSTAGDCRYVAVLANAVPGTGFRLGQKTYSCANDLRREYSNAVNVLKVFLDPFDGEISVRNA